MITYYQKLDDSSLFQNRTLYDYAMNSYWEGNTVSNRVSGQLKQPSTWLLPNLFLTKLPRVFFTRKNLKCHFGKYLRPVIKKWKFLFLVEIDIFGGNRSFWSKSIVLVEIDNFGRNRYYLVKIDILVEIDIFWLKSIFCSKWIVLVEIDNFDNQKFWSTSKRAKITLIGNTLKAYVVPLIAFCTWIEKCVN